MNNKKANSKLIQQRITLMLALLLCFFVSSLEYMPEPESVKVENHANSDSEQTFLNVALDAVVPFALQVSHSVFYLIYEIISFEPKTFVAEVVSVFQPNQLVEILFERIISTKGP
ncbi:hypothetical protein [Algoriphagus sp. CAU 1675]|uniref:hypothetical protein n=1 Tax=Algoriphagus sp. CAU 1675 TaxID=3032597 RepID=UPI0023DBEBFA|nr:hypothetical protein [Algoriphagus sp. CAU 1675]MDF2156278.1 hypothetical protein [Algoriphagus sp. CAU 1675]